MTLQNGARRILQLYKFDAWYSDKFKLYCTYTPIFSRHYLFTCFVYAFTGSSGLVEVHT